MGSFHIVVLYAHLEKEKKLSSHRVRGEFWLLQVFCIGEVAVIRAIPKKLLIHEVIHAKKSDTDRWGASELINRQSITSVRMEPSSKIVRDKNNAEIQLAATLFYDCKNSKPNGMSFAEDDVIIFNGENYQIKTVDPLYDERKLHHFELGLIRNG